MLILHGVNSNSILLGLGSLIFKRIFPILEDSEIIFKSNDVEKIVSKRVNFAKNLQQLVEAIWFDWRYLNSLN